MSSATPASKAAHYRLCLSVCMVVSLGITSVPHAYAIESFLPAAYVLGQDDGTVSAPEPIYTKGTANNAAHKLGLNAPAGGIVMDTTDHRLFVSDTSNHRVLVYGLDVSNNLIDRIPDNVLGQENFWGNTAAATQSGMSTPNGIDFDDDNNRLFVTQGVSTTSARVTVYDVTAITDGENAVNVLGQVSFTANAAASTQEGLRLPTGVAYDSVNNRLFVAQNTGNRVTVFDTTVISDGEPAINVLGQTDFTTITAATTQAGMNVPFDVALSGSTTLFVSQGTGNRVTAYNVGDGITDGENAIKVLGQANFTATALGNTQVGMNAPRGIAYDSVAKKLYVSQTTGNRVTVYNLADGITDGENAINVLGQTLFTTITAGVTQAGLSGPMGVYIDKANSKLYVPQSGASRVSVFDVAAITNGENAADVLGQSDDSLTAPLPIYTKGTANNASLRTGMNAPWGVAVDGINHRLFVTDGTNNRVLVYNLTTDNILIDRTPDNVLGQANYYSNATATTQAGMTFPIALSFDEVGNRLFVADNTNNRVLVFDTASITDGENATGVIGQANFTLATVAITQDSTRLPRALAYDSTSGHLYVADFFSNRIVVFDATTVVNGELAINVIGQDEGTVGSPQPIYSKSTANNAAHKLGLDTPTIGVVMDTVDHRLFVSDTTNNRVLVYNLDANNELLDRTPDNVLGQLNFYANALGNTRIGLRTPNGLAYDHTGKRLFVAEASSNRVKIFDVASITDGEEALNVLGQTLWTGSNQGTTQSTMNVPTGVSYDDATDRLYVAENTNNRVLVFDLAAGYTDYPNAENLLGQYDETSLTAPVPMYTKTVANNGPNRLGYSSPTYGLTMDTVDHRLFVSDMSNHRVLVYNLDTNNLLLDRIPDNVLGQVNFYAGTLGSTQNGMNAPMGLAYDSNGKRLFVAQETGNRVTVYDVTSITDGENAVNVLGQTNFTTVTAAQTQAGMNNPDDLVYDSANNRLFVSQVTGARVTVYDVATISNGENAINVLGQVDFTTGGVAVTQSRMWAPAGLAFDPARQFLFVSQSTPNRVTVYDVTSITDGENAINVLGQTTFVANAAGTTQGGMNSPRGVSYHSGSQILFVAQTGANRVTAYDLASITDGENAINVLGQGTFTVGTAATTQAGMNLPYAVYTDVANNLLYVQQSTANRVSIFDIASITDGENAVDLLGQTDDNLAAPGPVYTKGAIHNGPNILGLSNPYLGLALDSTDHRLFVSDNTNNRVLVYNLDTDDALLDRVPDAILGQSNFYTGTQVQSQAGLNSPMGLAYDDANNRLFVSQGSGNRVTVFDAATITNGENAVNVLGQTTFTGFTQATTQAGLNTPQDLVYDDANSRLFVAQSNGNRVSVYDTASITDGENAINVLGQTTFTATTAATTQAGMNVPRGLALSGSTTLFVSEGSGNRVTVYDVTAITDGENAINVLGQANFTATTAATTQVGMNAPVGASYDETNKILYVVQNTGRSVLSYNLADGITNGENAVNVIGQPNFTTATSSADQNNLSLPNGVLVDSAHNRLYVIDGSTANRVLVFHLRPGIGNGENAVSVLGQANFTTATAATTQAGMNVPYDTALSGSTTLFVSQGTGNRVTAYNIGDGITDGENAIKVLGQATFTATALGNTQVGMNAPRGIAYNPVTKTLFVSQTTGNRITTYNLGDGITDGENAVNVLGQAGFTTIAAAVTQGGLSGPTGVYIDSANSKLYAPQSAANRVSVFDIATITNGEPAVNLLGQTDNDLNPPGPVYTKGTANNAAYKMGLSAPQGLAVDAVNHRLFVSDTTNNRVLVYNLSVGNVLIDTQPDNVLGQANFYDNAIATTQAGLSGPIGLVFDSTNNLLYVADGTNNRVVTYDTASITDGENAVAVQGQASYIVATAGTTQFGLSAPKQLAYDSTSGQLFVGDSGNNRVIIYTVNPPTEVVEPAAGGGDIFHFFGW
ncbi:hypothetical protein K8942_00585 [Candidatus Peribacteria bacterium]|nr:MAG: hypothetical protein K8942_00585 [Candidatus Peribacteria bacterium]